MIQFNKKFKTDLKYDAKKLKALFESKKDMFDSFKTTAISRYQDAAKFR